MMVARFLCSREDAGNRGPGFPGKGAAGDEDVVSLQGSEEGDGKAGKQSLRKDEEKE